MAEIHHFENRHDVIFSPKDKMVHNDMLTAMIWPKSKPYVEFKYYDERLGEFNGMSSQTTCHIAGCCHLANSMS